jgi:hypothetical protein
MGRAGALVAGLIGPVVSFLGAAGPIDARDRQQWRPFFL